MLRTTITRIKKVCTIAFIPRVLRGDQRCAPVSYAVIRIAQKSTSTKPPDDSDQATTDKRNDGASYLLTSGEEIKADEKNKKRPLSHHERCKRIVDQAFGSVESTDDPDRVQDEQYCSHTVNIEKTKREIIESEKALLKLKESVAGSPIIPDDRTQYGLFKMSRELIFEDAAGLSATDKVAQVKEPPQIHASTVRVVTEPDLSKNLKNMEQAQEVLKQNEAKVHEACKHLGPPTLKEEEQEKEEYKAHSEEAAEAIELLKEKYQMHHATENTEDKSSIVNATTAKKNEEELAQKVENIEETPLVETEKPKMEGFNTPPQVLGDAKPTYNTVSSENNFQLVDDYSDAIDQVATRCLRSPVGKIDEMLINELENLDIHSNCNTESKSPAMDSEDDLVQMNESKEPPNSDPVKDGLVGMRPISVEVARDVEAILPNVNEQTDKVVLKPEENVFVKNELTNVPKENTVDVSAKQDISENVSQLNTTPAATENTFTDVIKPSTDNVISLEPQSMVSENSRLPNIMPESELPPLKLQKRKFLFRSKKTLNPEELPLKSDFVIDDVSPIASYNENYPKTVDQNSGHEGQPSLEGNDAKDVYEQQKMNENLSQLHSEMTGAPDAEKTPAKLDNNPLDPLFESSKAAPDNSKLSDNPSDDEPLIHEHKTSSERKRQIVGQLSNHIDNAEELPINVEQVNIVGSPIAPHDPYFLENMKREISAPLSLTEPTVGRVEEQKVKKGHQLRIESAEIDVKNPDKDSISSHNLTFTNVAHHKYDENKHVEKAHDFERIQNQPEIKKELQDVAVPTQLCTVNKHFLKIPFSNFRLPNSKWSHIGRRGKMSPLPNDIHPENSEVAVPNMVNATGKAILPNEVLRQSDMAYMNSVKPELAYEKGTNEMAAPSMDKKIDLVMEEEKFKQPELTERVENDEYNEDFPAKSSSDEQSNLVIKSGELEPEPELDLNKETSTNPLKVHAYAFKKGIELVDEDYGEDVQAKRSLDYDLVMESEKFKHNDLNLMCKESCAISPKPVGLGDIALAYEQATNIAEHGQDANTEEHEQGANIAEHEQGANIAEHEQGANIAEYKQNFDYSQAEETTHGTAASPEQEQLSDIGYSYGRGTNLVVTEDVDDYPAKRSLDDMVMEFKSIPRPQQIQTIIQAQSILDKLPSLAEDVSLSELLRRVRQRSRLMAFNNDCKTLAIEVVPMEAKCPRKSPRCPPTAPRSPPNNPIPPPSFGLPMLKRRPPACKPKRKPNITNCSSCDQSKICGVQVGVPLDLEMFYKSDEACGLFVRSSEADLTEVVIDHLQTLGRTLAGVLRQVKSQVETLFARDYEPWVPIPSWPHTKKVDKPKVQPGYHGVPPCITGCPVFPKANVSRNPEPRCNPRPCEGFPKRSFSMLDCFAVSLGENQVYDLGQF